MKRLCLLLFSVMLPLTPYPSESQQPKAAMRTPSLKPGEVFVSDAKWVKSAKLEDDISRYSNSVGNVLKGMKQLASEFPMRAREKAEITFYTIARRGLPVQVWYMHVGDNWTIRIDPADTENEGPHAPNTLLLTADGKWELIHHEVKANKPDTFLVASGNW